jgi:hypothetical protein
MMRFGAGALPDHGFEPEMSDIFQEVDDEVRRDKAAEFWAKHQNWIYAGVAVIVIAAAGYRFYDYRRVQASQAAGAEYQRALDAVQGGKGADAIAILDGLSAQGPSGFRGLARLAAAGIMAKTDAAGAIGVYDGIAGDSSLGPLFQGAARVRAALLRLDVPAEAAKGEADLKAVAGGQGAFRRLAHLTLGALALARNDYDGAAAQYELVVSDPEASAPERRQAEQGLGLVASNKAGGK